MYITIPTIATLTLLTILTKATLLAPHAQITTAPEHHLYPRQESYTCDTGYTSCTGWGGGCCPSDAPCTIIDGQPGCDAVCNGVVICGHLCCDIGYQCSADSLCVKEVYTVPVPSDPGWTLSAPAGTVTATATIATSAGGTGSSQSGSDIIYTIQTGMPTASSSPVFTSSGRVSSSRAASSSSVGGSSSPVTSPGVSSASASASSSSSGATSPVSSTKPVQTGGASVASALGGSSVLAWVLTLFFGIGL